MSRYRVFVLNGAGRIAGPPIDIECPDDESALRDIRAHYLDGRVLEVWEAARLVAVVTPSGLAPYQDPRATNQGTPRSPMAGRTPNA